MKIEETEQYILNMASAPRFYSLLGLSSPAEHVHIHDDKCTIHSRNKDILLSMSHLELNIVNKAIYDLIPNEFRMEMYNEPEGRDGFKARCSIVNTRRHLTLAFAYGDTTLIASVKCLMKIFNIISEEKHIINGS